MMLLRNGIQIRNIGSNDVLKRKPR
ncbi:uncharacterized protein FFB20_02894 [Fusarium fujikuroi]|nr:uncharacterized protein FFB20_02894 [Fusarium fujikuroi]SCN90786.1 uncharacterized protein FFE2_07083 [Fusarium fujikuroi]SCN98350.1 uncharacterized protein FFM5_06807 [Fusarium fujikuroi]SCO19385.1 uncharacterized protein FFC1_13542 [Fusarium fujikuroi]SCO38869.1 uncharacterized protein FFMR_05416 [Fusarium fujikuroi]